MNDTLAASLQGLQLVMSWPNIIWPVAGTLLSMLVSLLPGISGVALDLSGLGPRLPPASCLCLRRETVEQGGDAKMPHTFSPSKSRCMPA